MLPLATIMRTGQSYTFPALIRNPEDVPIGSSVVFIIDPNDPAYYFPQFILEQK